MASPDKRLDTNAPGPFFVDRTCIDCGTCNWVAPDSFDRSGTKSRVYRQPETPDAARRAEMAVIACPVAAIGAEDGRKFGAALAAWPELIDETDHGAVYHCGFHARKSFGAASYLLVRPEGAPGGNVMIDSPRFAGALVKKIEALGGVQTMFLTHMDDVADHKKWAAHFGCERLIHEADVRRTTREVERKFDGDAPFDIAPDLTVIPVPGHTPGSSCLLAKSGGPDGWRGRWLFSGDHVAWSADLGQIYAFRGACWYDWSVLQKSMARLAEHDFEWILPGHGRRCHFPGGQMRVEMARCLDWMQEAA